MLYNTHDVVIKHMISYITHVMLYNTWCAMLYNKRYITHDYVLLYKTCYVVILHRLCHVMLYNMICMLYNTRYFMLYHTCYVI